MPFMVKSSALTMELRDFRPVHASSTPSPLKAANKREISLPDGVRSIPARRLENMRIAVIGAGLAGLSCASSLADGGTKTVVFEKSRSLAGRCATRKWGAHIVDHGAQFFTIHSEEFRRACSTLPSGSLCTLRAPVVGPAGEIVPGSGERHYLREGNNRFGRHLAANLDVRLEAPVTSVVPLDAGWEVSGERFDGVVLTAPWPQSAALLGLPAAPDPFTRCLTAFFSYLVPFDAAQMPYAIADESGDPLAWSACENHKDGRVAGEETVFVVQASPAFSAEQFDRPPAAWLGQLQPMLEARWKLPSRQRLESFAHRWRYSKAAGGMAKPDLPANLWVAGDGFGTSRVESAWLSGRETALSILAGKG